MLLLQGTLEHVFIFITHFRIKLFRPQGTNDIVQSMEDKIVNPPKTTATATTITTGIKNSLVTRKQLSEVLMPE